MDFEVKRCTRRCAATDRELAPGEEFFSVLIAEGAEVVRHDYSAEAWTGPPEKVLGWWKSRMPTPESRQLHWAPNDVMLHYFEQLAENPEKQDVRYVLALLLVRRRVMRFEESEQEEGTEGRRQMVLYCPRRETTYKVLDVAPHEARIEEIQDELAALLFAKSDSPRGPLTARLLWIVVGLIVFSGASCLPRVPSNSPNLPSVLPQQPTLEQVINVVNQNSGQIQTLSTNEATLSSPDFPTLHRTRIQFERPRRFRLRASTGLTGPELDIGSNDELFWIWVRRNEPRVTYACRHDQFANSPVRQTLPIDPDWLIEAVGPASFDPALPHQGPYPQSGGRFEVRTILDTPNGHTTKVTLVEGHRGIVLEQHMYDANGKLTASAITLEHRRDPLTGLTIPKRVVVECPRVKFSMQIDLGNAQVNRPIAGSPQIWTKPHYEGWPTLDLCHPNLLSRH